MARLMAKLRIRKVVLVPLVAPGLDAGRRVRIPLCQVLAVGAARVLELAVALLEVGAGEGGDGLVPRDGAGVVLVAVEVGAVEDGGCEF